MENGNSTMKMYLPLLLALVAFAPTVVFADVQYKTIVIAPATPAPISIDACEAWARDWNKTSLGMRAVIPNALAEVGVKFTNTSTKTIKAARFEFTSYDAFNAVLKTA